MPDKFYPKRCYPYMLFLGVWLVSGFCWPLPLQAYTVDMLSIKWLSHTTDVNFMLLEDFEQYLEKYDPVFSLNVFVPRNLNVFADAPTLWGKQAVKPSFIHSTFHWHFIKSDHFQMGLCLLGNQNFFSTKDEITALEKKLNWDLGSGVAGFRMAWPQSFRIHMGYIGTIYPYLSSIDNQIVFSRKPLQPGTNSDDSEEDVTHKTWSAFFIDTAYLNSMVTIVLNEELQGASVQHKIQTDIGHWIPSVRYYRYIWEQFSRE